MVLWIYECTLVLLKSGLCLFPAIVFSDMWIPLPGTSNILGPVVANTRDTISLSRSVLFLGNGELRCLATSSVLLLRSSLEKTPAHLLAVLGDSRPPWLVRLLLLLISSRWFLLSFLSMKSSGSVWLPRISAVFRTRRLFVGYANCLVRSPLGVAPFAVNLRHVGTGSSDVTPRVFPVRLAYLGTSDI